MAEQILWNPAALGALKRHQLVSLSKKYGLKANGKNVDLIDRLQEYAASVGPNLQLYLPEPEPTPAPSRIGFPMSDPISPTRYSPMPKLSENVPQTEVRAKRASIASRDSRRSGSWEVLSESGASMISPKKDVPELGGSVSSWKSAGNGEKLSDFGLPAPETKVTSSRSRHSMLDLASSLKRSASKGFLFGRSTSQGSDLSMSAMTVTEPGSAPPEEPAHEEPMEEMQDVPPSPASTVGIPRRHSRISLLERPSTIRLCLSPPPEPVTPAKSDDGSDILPFVGSAAKLKILKERRSMAPLRGPMGRSTSFASSSQGANLVRKSLPVLPHSTSASLTSIYPPLPRFNDAPPVPALPETVLMPGALPPAKITPMKVFGETGESSPAVSKEAFSAAAQAVLREMNAKLPEGSKMLDGELLKGKKAEMKRLVSVNEKIGEGGWGIGSHHSGSKDRYAAAHDREFAKMKSIDAKHSQVSIAIKASSTIKIHPITPGLKRKHSTQSDDVEAGPSAPNGKPMEDGRQSKKKRLSMGPDYMGSLREAGKSLVNLLSDKDETSITPAMQRRMQEKRQKRRDSLVNGRGKGFSHRFDFFKGMRKTTPTTPAATARGISVSQTTSTASSSLRSSIKSAAVPQSALYRERNKLRRKSADLTNLIKPSPDLPSASIGQPPRDRNVSTSASTVLSAPSRTPSRPRIPEFVPTGMPTGILKHRSGSTNTLGLPKPMRQASDGSNKLIKKASQAAIINSARPVPPPPSTLSSSTSDNTSQMAPPAVPSLTKRTSTLLMPTASSLARMQATIKPNPSRPLPTVPAPYIATTKPFGPGASRDNLFETNWNVRPDFGASTTTVNTLYSSQGGGTIYESEDSRIDVTPKAYPKIHVTPKKSTHNLAGTPKTGTPGKKATPGRSGGHSATARARQAGIQGMKSKGNVRQEIEVQRRRAEIRAKQERLGEERQLREMLGQMDGNTGMQVD